MAVGRVNVGGGLPIEIYLKDLGINQPVIGERFINREDNTFGLNFIETLDNGDCITIHRGGKIRRLDSSMNVIWMISLNEALDSYVGKITGNTLHIFGMGNRTGRRVDIEQGVITFTKLSVGIPDSTNVKAFEIDQNGNYHIITFYNHFLRSTQMNNSFSNENIQILFNNSTVDYITEKCIVKESRIYFITLQRESTSYPYESQLRYYDMVSRTEGILKTWTNNKNLSTSTELYLDNSQQYFYLNISTLLYKIDTSYNTIKTSTIPTPQKVSVK